MTSIGGAYHDGQQLLELLSVVSECSDEESAAHAAVERAAQALDAEVAAVVIDDEVAAVVGFPVGRVPQDDLVAVAHRERDNVDVPGVGHCHAIAADWGGSRPGHLVLARWGERGFSVEERNVVRGMARLLELALTMLRTLQAEHEMRERSERQAAENAELLASLQQRQRLLEHLFDVQRAISRRRPLPQVLDMIAAAARQLLGDGAVGLWLRDDSDPQQISLVAGAGLAVDIERETPTMPLAEAGTVGAAIMSGGVVVCEDDSTEGVASMAAPVHDSGTITGGLVVMAERPGRVYAPPEVQMLQSFAEHVSLALTDANTVDRMHQAFHDSVTGLASRSLFLDRLAHQLELTGHGGGRVALLFIDLDRFKAINDTLGHAAGDTLLTITADRIVAQLRDSDVAARFGGDEFAVMLQNVSTPGDAAKVADRILRGLHEPMRIAGRQLQVNASIGIALSTHGMTDPAALVRRADIAMYRAKRNGRGRYDVFADEMLLAFTDGETQQTV
ncbi:sensor domain-containing diguanylate cyclase [Kutzneria kofuensis]|uniref:Diguanylate cyclase (GGDEF)-like protein n=1 Tax=Kutzneria kofuensis TaxID=103725 RepID=A0A7W9KAZ8_9PSEU|nr:sensor domain-containing diguanylate cyclase [Kutzneria kofuensis]MBB5889277.1 diguanylate cyclase (GGDEF)-like protein [Kutzneria kofuensis]